MPAEVKPIAKVLDEWWTEHAGQHDDPQWINYLSELKKALDIKLVELSSSHENRIKGTRVYGMSKAAGCTRAANLSLLEMEKAPFPGHTLFTFSIGHMIECMAIATMRAAGFDVEDSQEGVEFNGIMKSYSDGMMPLDHGGRIQRAPLSVKSMGYKFSRKDYRSGKWVRQGFASLPFEGFMQGNTSGWAQIQAEIAGHDLQAALVLVAAKDIVKAYEEDPYMQSLTFYTEVIERDDIFIDTQLTPTWEKAWADYHSGAPGAPMYLHSPSMQYVRLPRPADKANGWKGPNQDVTGTFNPCFGCDFRDACARTLKQPAIR